MAKKKARGATPLHQQRDAGPSAAVTVALKLLGVVLAIGAVAWGTQSVLDPARLPVHTVRIESPLKNVSQQAVRERVRPHAEAGFVGVDVDAVRDSLLQLPWVYQASVRRAWPDKLVINISEQQPLARWGNEALVNVHGELFFPQQTGAWKQLPLLRGPRQTSRMVAEQYRVMLGLLKPLGLGITHLSLNERRALSVRLDNGLQLGLGRQHTARRLVRFVRVYPQALAPRLEAIDSIDLRYTNGLAVRWRDGFEPSSV